MTVRASHYCWFRQKRNAVTLTRLSEAESREVSFYAHQMKLKTWLSCDLQVYLNKPLKSLEVAVNRSFVLHLQQLKVSAHHHNKLQIVIPGNVMCTSEKKLEKTESIIIIFFYLSNYFKQRTLGKGLKARCSFI